MQLASVRDLKSALQASVLTSLAAPAQVRAFGVSAGPMVADAASRSVALGIVPVGKNNFHLAVRVQRQALDGSATVEAIRKQAKGEVDVRFVGRLVKRDLGTAFQQRLRPLQIGGSVGHFKITAGTVGGFVHKGTDTVPFLLSNNHVLANENRAKKGDAVLQPGQFDQGVVPGDVVGTLAGFVRLKRAGANLVDCALSSLTHGLAFDAKGLDSVGQLSGVRAELLRKGEILHKVGRTTGVTRGRVTAIEVDNLVIGYDIGNLRFDQQIEIEGADDEAFSAGGDSGSLIVDDTGKAVALLFAGGDQGGTNGKGLTYANPLRPVLDALKVDLMF